MKLTTKKIDLFKHESFILLHGCNAQAVFGSGIALAVKKQFPSCYSGYQQFCGASNYYKGFDFNYDPPMHGLNYIYCDFERMGKIYLYKRPDGGYIANLHTQLRYGADGKRYTDYEAVAKCLETLRGLCDFILGEDGENAVRLLKTGISFPYKMCSDRGGADWNVIEALINSNFEDMPFPVVACQI